MISDFGAMISATVQLFSVEFTIYGFTFSFWEVFLFSIAASIVVWILARIFLDD